MYKNVYKYDDMKRAEHMAVRQTVGWYFWTHQLLEVTGSESGIFLDYLYPNNIQTLKVGKDRYTTMLNDSGEIIDDVVIMRMGENQFWISTLFLRQTQTWIKNHAEGYDVQWNNITDAWDMFAVQGPKSKDVINMLTERSIDDLKFFSCTPNTIKGKEVIINRGGFTGEKWGYEIYCHSEDAVLVEELLRHSAAEYNGRQVTDFQIMAWTLPTESGFYYMRDLAHTNPFEVGLEANINWEKDFIGKDALLKVKEHGPEREMIGFEVPEADIYIRSQHLGGPGEPVYIDDEEIGRVVKLVYSYVKDINNGYILAKKDALKLGDHINIHGYEAIITDKKWI